MKESSDRRGGPRPGFGGKQPGAGRPAQIVDGPRSVVLDAVAIQKLDSDRGKMSRKDYLTQLIERSTPA